jgi:hypothetical protein
MGAVPEEKSGVASAMNDVTAQVAGALGTAVIGSLITVALRLAHRRLGRRPAERRRIAAEDSVGQANAVAAHAPGGAGREPRRHRGADAFTHALGIGFTVAGGHSSPA